MLKVLNVSKKYGELVAVDNLSFEVKEGEIFGLLGLNGAGKTTTFRMIMGLIDDYDGEILLDGRRIDYNISDKIGFLTEERSLLTKMTVLEQIKYYGVLKGMDEDEIEGKLDNYLTLLQMDNKIKNKKIKELSKGNQQKIQFISAIIHEPKLLILDEPLSGLDPAGVKEVRSFLIALARKHHIAILVSSHMLGEMELLCDTIGIINNGQLIEQKTINQLKQGQESTKRVKLKVGTPNFAGKIILNELKFKVDIAGDSIIVHANENYISQITECLIKYKVLIYGIEVISKSLEDIFMEIINKKNAGNHNIF